MFQLKAFRNFARSMKILLMLLLIGFELVPGLSGGDMAYINQASLQLTRSQIIINAAYTLVYRPEAERVQALHNLQSVLPPFEREQTLLLTNATIEAQDLLQQARLDYLPLLAAAQIIMAHPNAESNSAELAIIIVHQPGYVLTMNLLLLILPRSFEDRNVQLFIIQFVIQALFLIMFLITLMTFPWEKHVQTDEKTKVLSLKILVSKRAIFVFLLLFMLVGLELVPLKVGSDATYLNQAALQRTRCEAFARYAFALAYSPAAEKTLALSNVQFVLPLFQQEHATLLSNAEVRSLVRQGMPEYQAMVTAAQALSVHPGGKVDLEVVNTIVSQTPQCLSNMNAILLTLQNAIQQRTSAIFFAEVAIEGVYIVLFAALLLLSREPLVLWPKREKVIVA